MIYFMQVGDTRPLIASDSKHSNSIAFKFDWIGLDFLFECGCVTDDWTFLMCRWFRRVFLFLLFFLLEWDQNMQMRSLRLGRSETGRGGPLCKWADEPITLGACETPRASRFGESEPEYLLGFFLRILRGSSDMQMSSPNYTKVCKSSAMIGKNSDSRDVFFSRLFLLWDTEREAREYLIRFLEDSRRNLTSMQMSAPTSERR